MKVLIAILAVFALTLSASAEPIVKVANGYVDWCHGFTDEKAEAKCIHGEHAFDLWGNLIIDPDGEEAEHDDGDDS